MGMTHTNGWRLNSALAGLLCLSALLGVPAARSAEPPAETRQERDKRMQWWREAKFGMFIHWGVYAVPAGTYHGQQIEGIGEWIMRRAKIPVAEYRAFARQFNPVQYDPEAWADLAKEAGMKYMIITSKHHDGFALFDSKASDWNVVDATPYGKDLLAPLAAAARKRGLKFGLYYSQAQDWTNPGGAKSGLNDGEGWCEEHKGSFDEYLKKIAEPQVREILTHYQPDVLWWDTPRLMTKERADRLRPLIALRPGLITNNRLGGGYGGDTETPEQHIPDTGYKDRDWETCMTMNGTWGYKSYDQNWKSAETLIRNLVDIVSKGGNYLLNVGPTAEGLIPQPSVERLKAIGAWMKVNGEAIYGTTASPCRQPSWGRIATKAHEGGATLYLHVFDWPKDGQLVVPVTNKAASCFLLADKTRSFKTAAGDRGLAVKLTGAAPDAICSVVVLEIQGAPQAAENRISQKVDGSIVLPASEAQTHGRRVRVEQKGGKPNLGLWTDASDWVEWPIDLSQPGRFEVSAEVAGPRASRFTIEAGGRKLEASTPATGGYTTFQNAVLGQIELASAGSQTLAVRPAKRGWSAINIRVVKLKLVR